VTLPRPASMSVDAVKEAHTAFNHVVGWRDEPSLAWLCFALRMAHRHKKYKTAALRMLARVATTGTHVGGRTPGSVLARLKQVAREVALTLTPLLLRYIRHPAHPSPPFNQSAFCVKRASVRAKVVGFG
jgi:hypothetical protein